jgi:hypothetical protein
MTILPKYERLNESARARASESNLDVTPPRHLREFFPGPNWITMHTTGAASRRHWLVLGGDVTRCRIQPK